MKSVYIIVSQDGGISINIFTNKGTCYANKEQAEKALDRNTPRGFLLRPRRSAKTYRQQNTNNYEYGGNTMTEHDKTPLGLKPYWVAYPERIDEILFAIKRQICSTKTDYGKVIDYLNEALQLAKLIKKLQGETKQ